MDEKKTNAGFLNVKCCVTKTFTLLLFLITCNTSSVRNDGGGGGVPGGSVRGGKCP